MSARPKDLSACDLKRAAIKATNWKTFVSNQCVSYVFYTFISKHIIILFGMFHTKKELGCRISSIHNRVCIYRICLNCLNIEWMEDSFFCTPYAFAWDKDVRIVSIPSSL